MLEECSRGWCDGGNEIMPWWNAYGDLVQKIEDTTSAGPKGDLVRRVIYDQVGPFVISDLAAMAPGVSLSLLKKKLMSLKKEWAVKSIGRGRGAAWEVGRKS